MVKEFIAYKFSRVLLGEKLENVKNYIPENAGQVIIITDTNVSQIYRSSFPDWPVIEIGLGEKIKTQDTVRFIIDELLKLGADRHTFLVGIGGGIVCDIAGYAASIFMRGIRFGYVSTSLLSQVDASIGGKTGVNFKGYKNLLGVFNQPEFVICDTGMLSTLPGNEVKNGLVEIIKHAVIADAEMFTYIEEHLDQILGLDEEAITYLVSRSIEIKSDIVLRDERESGERKKLNLGHTYGHAVESLLGISHGEAVALGLVFAADISVMHGHCTEETATRIKKLVSRLGFTSQVSVASSVLLDAMMKDKKRKSDAVDYVFINQVGAVFIETLSYEGVRYAIISRRPDSHREP
jgi:3-dehydroquinate synthase